MALLLIELRPNKLLLIISLEAIALKFSYPNVRDSAGLE